MKQKIFFLLGIIGFFYACNSYRNLPKPTPTNDWKVKKIAASPQLISTDVAAGFIYLTEGGYVGSGIPFSFIEPSLKPIKDTVFNRTGDNSKVDFTDIVFEKNGAKVTTGSCFSCHAGYLDGELILGMGDSFKDFQKSLARRTKLLKFVIAQKYKKGSPERLASHPYISELKEMTPYIQTPNPGVNIAFRMEEAFVNHRDPNDLTFHEEKNFDMPKYTLASDVPPLWNVKKKNGLYYNGMGRGDYGKLLMQAAMAGVVDTTQAREILPNFEDVLAWIYALEPPKYPKNIDRKLATKGKVLFEENCAKCHGKYGEEESYPNKIVALEVVKTDGYYTRYFSRKNGLADWYNESWMATSNPSSKLEPSDGYIAPPLDGIWATAPYLHNASVPDLDALLNSSSRPKYWQRSWKKDDYNYEEVGWNYQEMPDKSDEHTYDTTLPGYGNQGHYFGDELTNTERKAVIEYLKML